MGTIYFVACRDCNVVRDLDKFYDLCHPVENRADALKLSERFMKSWVSFRAALLSSFMWKHKGHNCTVFSEHDPEMEKLNPYDDSGFPREEKVDFWEVNENESPTP